MKSNNVAKGIRLVGITIIFVIMSCLAVCAANGNETVYVTNTGECYHSYGCGYLRKSSIPISLEDAVFEGYRRCSKCHPPVYDAQNDSQRIETEQSSKIKQLEEIDNQDQAVSEIIDNKKEEKHRIPWWIILALIVSGYIGIRICISIVDKKKEIKKKALEEQRLKEEKDAFLKMLDGRPIREVANVPANVRFVNDMPADNNDKLYGTFTVYISKNGKRYHEKQGCRSAHYARHRFNMIGNYVPCYKCCKDMTQKIPQWYKDYETLKNDCRKYGVDIHINEPFFPIIEGSKTYYCKNGESVTIKNHPNDEEMMVVIYKGKEYIRSKSRIGIDFFEKTPVDITQGGLHERT